MEFLVGIFAVFYMIVSTLSVGIYFYHYKKFNKWWEVLLTLLCSWWIFPFIVGVYLGNKFIEEGDKL